jgi:multidrug efflux pump subunit AcrA (membrane-fusion protein)
MRFVGWFMLAAAVASLPSCGSRQAVQARQDSGPVAITAAPVTTREIQRVVEAVGTLYPYDEVIISAEVEGPVQQVNVDLGDAVSQGQVLVRISDEEQRYLVAQNEAQLRQSLERLGLTREDEKVRDIRETPEVRRAQADLVDAEQRHKRMRDLSAKRIVSQQDVDQAEARLNAMQATYDATLNQTRNLIQEVERFKASLDLQRKKLRDTTVRAPYAAYVKERLVTAGQYVRANTPLFTLVKINPIRLRIEIPERMAPWVRQGQEAEVAVEAYGERTFHGRVWRISPTVDQSKRTFIVEALIPNPASELKPGSYAKARVRTGMSQRIRLIPFRAVNYVLGSYKAYVVTGATVQARELKLGDRFGQDVEVLEGLDGGEQVATSQVTRLDSGVRVRVAAPAASQE